MTSLRKATKRVHRWQRYFWRTIKPLVGDDYASHAELQAWVRSGNVRIRNLQRRQADEEADRGGRGVAHDAE